ncbi:phospholipase D-like domain-containing protein [uncultured Jatrophihabitans sp.]|uniref:phospholipase D-like domain-containing protein n=1 Tax=uncultured Jatrophihabitans sp. TaxID=1610747 RepID=UPI0035C9FAFC
MAVDYFPAATADCPTFVEDTEWHPLVDGARYFAELDEQLHGLGEGDAVLVAGLTVDPDLDLCGRAPGDPDFAPLGGRLAEAAAAGATIRVLIAGRVWASSIPSDALGGFRTNAQRARRLRAWTLEGAATPPLAGCVLLDFSGALLGSNHQKVVVVVRGGVLTAYVGGIDLEMERLDNASHDTLRLKGNRWGWHDAAVRLRGRAAVEVWQELNSRWKEASTLPRKKWLRRLPVVEPLNPGDIARPADSTPAGRLVSRQPPVEQPGVSVRVLRSMPAHKFESLLPGRTLEWDYQTEDRPRGVQDVFHTLTTAFAAAQRYIYLEDQYLGEELGGRPQFELYPALLAALRRGVRVILVGSGIRDPDDAGYHPWPINRRLNRDLRDKIFDRLSPRERPNFVVARIEHATVHAKLVLVDDAFACVGSANMFSRSMGGVDRELSTAVQTSTSLVRDLRVALWAEHLRTPLTDELRESLADLDQALGIWNADWLVPGAATTTWRSAGEPAGFAPRESVVRRVDA